LNKKNDDTGECMRGEKLTPVGKIGRPHGIRGEIKVIPCGDWPDSVLQSQKFLLRLGQENEKWLATETARKHGNAFLIKLSGVDSRDAAGKLRGGLLLLRKESLPPLEENTYYIDDLIGLKVITTEGLIIGRLDDVFQGGAHDIYVVKDGEREVMVPAVKAYIKCVDISAGTMIIEAVEGLLDYNEN
jgi:16S rRNA processing protein RimM